MSYYKVRKEVQGFEIDLEYVPDWYKPEIEELQRLLQMRKQLNNHNKLIALKILKNLTRKLEE